MHSSSFLKFNPDFGGHNLSSNGGEEEGNL